MNFEEYKAPRVQEINFVDFYVVKDFDKMGLMSLKFPYSLLDMIGEKTPIEGLEVEHIGHSFDHPYCDLVYDTEEYHPPRYFEPVVYEAKDLRYRMNGKLTYQREDFGENVRIVITPVFNEDKYNKALNEPKEEQKRLTEKFISDAIVVCAGAESDMLLEGKAYKLMDKAVAAPKDMVIDERFDQCKGFMFNGEFVKLNNTDKLVYSSMRDLIETTDEGIDEVFITQQTLADKYGVSIKTIQRSLAKFITYGFIAEKNTRGRCNTYIMNDIDRVDFRSEYINKNMKRDTSFTADCQPENTRWNKP